MNTQNVNVKTATQDPPKRWVKKLRAFAYQEQGRFVVKYTAYSLRGVFSTHHRYFIFAKSRLDAAFKFGLLAPKESDFVVDAVDVQVPIQDVCISTTGYHFTVDADQWRCLENGEFVEVARDGDIWNAERTYALPLYGHLQHDD
ncbi:hypothetical protein [Serratia sp. 14-2641]|uniref:hypothetical protein n=1 Tax=Serratia sp. 14-2641 TaxID=1841657 RepID=UPI00080F84B5|nr:hypothetical protein [Serratia sp. 14-2641]OCJ37380.1 hypothetical protein A6U95_25050 [Serratia sp. 14-2641]